MTYDSSRLEPRRERAQGSKPEERSILGLPGEALAGAEGRRSKPETSDALNPKNPEP